MKNKKLSNTFYIVGLYLLSTNFVLAEESSKKITSLDDLLKFVLDTINSLIPIIIALALLVFIWGVFRYVVAKSDEDKSQGRSIIVWGVVGLFVMVSVWGLVNILRGTFKLENTAPPLPQLPGSEN